MKCCVAVLLLGAAAIAQTPDPNLVFEAATVRPAGPNAGFARRQGGPGTPDPSRINYSNVPLSEIVRTAYRLNTYELAAPAWMQNTSFDIVAKLPAGATFTQFRVMLQNLLAERFDLAAHRETRDVAGYEMVVAKGGLKLKESANTGACTANNRTENDRDGLPQLTPGCSGASTFPIPNGSRYSFRQQPLLTLAELLRSTLAMPVLDKTGLTGKYDFNLTFTTRGPSTAAADDAAGDGPPDLFTAVQQQLGLRLEQKKTPVDVLVVDRAEKTAKEN
jgi:uncharacterized protein (TIGR03435 family)